MPRTSRKNRLGAVPGINAAETGKAGIARQRTYSVGIYARLSCDSHNEKNESIDTQIEIAKSYLELQPDMVLFDCYSEMKIA